MEWCGNMQDFYFEEKQTSRIYPPNQKKSECQIFYFLKFSTECSKFLERTLFHSSIHLFIAPTITDL